jgi:hypothetical protein
MVLRAIRLCESSETTACWKDQIMLIFPCRWLSESEVVCKPGERSSELVIVVRGMLLAYSRFVFAVHWKQAEL